METTGPGDQPVDPNAVTQPMGRVGPQPPPRQAAAPPPAGSAPPPGSAPPNAPPPATPPRARFDHRFGNLPSYLVGRLLAFAIDVPGIAFVLAAFTFDLSHRGYVSLAPETQAGFDTVALAAFAVALAFKFVCEAVFGTSVGKLVFVLHVRGTGGRHAGLGRAFVRNLVLPLDVLAIGPLLALVTPRHQRVGDLLAGTVVGRSPMGAFAPLVGLGLLALLEFAQVSYGGGLTSALGVAAETSVYVPAVLAAVRHGSLAMPPAPLAPVNARPSPEATASDVPNGAPTDAPNPNATDTPNATVTGAPEATDTPDASTTDEPEPTDAPESGDSPAPA